MDYFVFLNGKGCECHCGHRKVQVLVSCGYLRPYMLWWLVRDDYDPVMVVGRHTRKEAATVRIAAFAVTATA